MRPVAFEGANRTLMPPDDMPGCEPLATYVAPDQILSCWELEPHELAAISAGITKRVWIRVYTVAGTQPPIALHVESPFESAATT